MASFAICGRALVPICMAHYAVGIYVGARQRKICAVMVKTIFGVPCRMAGQAGRIFISISAHADMAFIRFGIDVATDAGKFGVVGLIIMTIGTLRPLPLMLTAVNREKAIVLRILSRHPPHVRRMAFRTTYGETCALVIGIQAAFKIRLVAGKAIGWRTRKIPCSMASGAILEFMPFGKGEEIMIEIIGRPVKAIGVMALGAIEGKARVSMVRVGGGVVIIQVAVHTIVADPVELQPRFRNVAFSTTQGGMRPQQREPIILV